MCSTASDILAVEILQKEAGNHDYVQSNEAKEVYRDNDKYTGNKHPQRVVPLFETVDDLRNSSQVMRRLFSIDWYLHHIKGAQVSILMLLVHPLYSRQ